MQRPIVTTTPALDLYRNNWNVGVALTYNLESIFKTSKKVSLGKYEIEKAKAQAQEAEQMIGVAVKAAHIKYEEAIFQNQTYQKTKLWLTKTIVLWRAVITINSLSFWI